MVAKKRIKLLWATVLHIRDGDYDCYYLPMGNFIGRLFEWLV